MCVLYIGLGSNGCFMTNTALMGDHYRMYVISGVGHPWSLSCAANVVDSNVQWSGHQHCIIRPSG
jgi:hypothetical protein